MKFENIFQKVFPKHIKRVIKIEQRLLTRFILKLNHLNTKEKHKFSKEPYLANIKYTI